MQWYHKIDRVKVQPGFMWDTTHNLINFEVMRLHGCQFILGHQNEFPAHELGNVPCCQPYQKRVGVIFLPACLYLDFLALEKHFPDKESMALNDGVSKKATNRINSRVILRK